MTDRGFFNLLLERSAARPTAEARRVIEQVEGLEAVESWFDVLVRCLVRLQEVTPHRLLDPSSERQLESVALAHWETMPQQMQEHLTIQFGEEMRDQGIADFRLQFKYTCARLAFFAFAAREI